MQEALYRSLVERLAQCQYLTEHARNPKTREMAVELADDYRRLIASADRLIRSKALSGKPSEIISLLEAVVARC